MVKTFDKFINLDKRIGKIFIIGEDEGVGKTLLSCAIQVNKMIRGRKDRLKSFKQVDEYNSYGYNFSKNYKHLCFSNYDCNCRGTIRPSLKTHLLNPFKVGLWCEDYDTDFFPPGSCLFITEAQRPFNAYMWPFVRPEIRAYWETGRQANIDAVFDTNKPKQVVNDIRSLCNRFIFLYKECEEIVKRGVCVGNILYVYEFKHWADVEKYLDSGTLQNHEQYELRLDRCYYKNYDSYQCRFLHLKGREKQDFKVEFFPEMQNVKDIEKFSDNFGLYPPPGYYKKNSDIKKTDIKNIEQEQIVF